MDGDTRLPADRSGWRSIPFPDPASLPTHTGTDGAVQEALARLDAWGRELQKLLDDPRRLRCERVWINPRDHALLAAWVAEPMQRADGRTRDAWESEWIWTAPSHSTEVPEGTVLVEPDAWDPPYRATAGGDTAPSTAGRGPRRDRGPSATSATDESEGE